MKNTLLILMSLWLCGCGEQRTDPAVSSISVSVDYTDRPYDYGEAVGVDLVITELAATNDFCYFTARCEGGTASLEVDGEAVAWGDKQTAYYDVLNEHTASRTMHCVITPGSSASVSQTLIVEFQVSSVTLDQRAVHRIEIQVDNKQPIVASAEYNPLPFEIGMLLDIELSAAKEGFVGELEVLPALQSGAGYFVYAGKNIEPGVPFMIPCPSTSTLHYQPTAKGIQDIVLTLTDGMQSATVEIHTEVYNNGGLESPPNGIYIYAGGVYYSRTRWVDSKPAVTAEGVAVVADACRFLIARTDVFGTWCGNEDIRKIEGLPNYEAEAEARTDYDGLQNTRKILAALDAGVLSSAPAARACYHYDKNAPGLWYMPASGQMALIVDNFSEIKQCLLAIDFYSKFTTGRYFTSTGRNTTVWTMVVDTYFVPKFWYFDPYYGGNCRPVRTLKSL